MANRRATRRILKKTFAAALSFCVAAALFSGVNITVAASSAHSVALCGGVEAEAASFQPGAAVALTVSPPEGQRFVAGSLKYSYTDGVGTPVLRQVINQPAGTPKGYGKGNVFCFTMPDRDVTVYADFVPTSPTDFSFSTIGASVHRDEGGGVDGIRFLSRLYLPKNDGGLALLVALDGAQYTVSDFGTMIIPKERLTGGLTVDNDSAMKASAFAGGSLYDLTENYVDFTVLMMGISAKLDRVYSVCAYVELENADGEKCYVYSDMFERSAQNYSTLPGGNYAAVDCSTTAEVLVFEAETFSGDTTDDFSKPINNNLPRGTVDYCTTGTIYDPDSGMYYRLLRCNKRVYVKDYGGNSVVSVSSAKLPDVNNVSVADSGLSGNQTYIKFKVDWKAPFKLDLLPQSYNINESAERSGIQQGYTITDATYTYVDVTFYYAATAGGDIDLPAGSVFSSYEWIQSGTDYILRLHLKNTGRFHGWSAEYNAAGELVFNFTNPHVLADWNSLAGVKVLIDAGHGGSDPGALGSNSYYDEAELNLILAKKLKARLESFGATVVMTREADVSVSSLERALALRREKPDLAISIHRNSSYSSSPSGFTSYHFNAYTHNAAQLIYDITAGRGIYSTNRGVGWHYFFLSRATDCPVVLTENGFVSNPAEYQNLMSDSYNDTCALALADSVLHYFRVFQ